MRLTIEQSRVVLGVSSDATPDQVRQAYRKLALQFHPDKNPDPSATEKFQQLSAAYKRLCDHEAKRSRGNQWAGDAASESDDVDAFGSDLDADDLDISFEEMLMMFEMMFGGATHRGSNSNSRGRKTVRGVKANAKKTAPQVRLPRRGGRGGSGSGVARRRGGIGRSGAFGPASLFGSAEEMLFQSFMTMDLAREMNDLEDDFKGMSSFFGDSFGDSDFSFGSDEDGCDSDGDDGDLFASATAPHFPRATHTGARTKAAKAPQQSSNKESTSSPDAKQQSSDDKSESKREAAEQSSSSQPSPIKLDAHVCVFGKLTGVVKFKGSVHYAKGEFVGVELAEPLGKNDGTVKGVAYFACPPQFGLMVRPEDVSLVA